MSVFKKVTAMLTAMAVMTTTLCLSAGEREQPPLRSSVTSEVTSDSILGEPLVGDATAPLLQSVTTVVDVPAPVEPMPNDRPVEDTVSAVLPTVNPSVEETPNTDEVDVIDGYDTLALDGVSVTVDAVDAEVRLSANAKLFPETMPGYIGQAVDLQVTGETTVSFAYDLTEGYVQPTIYYFSEATQTLEAVDTVIENGVVTASVTESATYVLLDRTVYEGSFTWEDTWGVSDLYGRVEVVLVIDDSGSQLNTDPHYHRLQVASDLLASLPDDSRVGIVRFSTVVTALTEQLTDAVTAASCLTTEYFRSDGGTAMYTAVEKGLSLFENDDTATQRVMVVLTDGISVDAHRYDSLVQTIVDREIVVHMVDIDNTDNWFTLSPERFAEDVGGTYHHAADVGGLAEVFSSIGRFIDLTVDTDGDTIPDYYEDHMLAFNGVRIPLDKNNVDTDYDGIPDDEEVSVTLVYSEDGTQVYVKGILLSDPTTNDSDGDGTTDDADETPFDNTFSGTLTTKYASGTVSFAMDYQWFSQDNTVYIPALGVASSVMSAMAYEESSLEISDVLGKRTTNAATCADLLTYFGMQNAESYALGTDYSDNHLSEVTVGYRNTVVDGQRRTVLAVVVRGTNTTVEEWSSNCDIGNLAEDTDSDDWINTDNHKGFDMAANRIMRFVQQYIDEQQLDRDVITYWVTGHSRGAAIADIIGANLEKAGRIAFTYAFATPNNTLASDASSYRSVFNIINQDDFVPRLPMAAWGYSCYGRSTTLSIKDSFETEWESLTGIFDYNPSSSVDSSVETLAGILPSGADPRIESYRYTCDCHGDGSNDTITITNTGISESSREKAIAKIPQNALPFCAITRYDGGFFGGWNFDVCQTPAYFMQLLAAFMGEAIDAYRFGVELNIADRYESAKSALVTVGVTGVEHAHYPESYYVLANHAAASDFS